MGLGSGGAFFTTGCGLGGGGGGGGLGASGSGAGGEMNSAITWAGTMTSSGARWSRPCCIAQRVAACKTTTEPAMATLRPRPPGGPKRSDWDIETEGAVSVWEPGAVARKTEYQLRRIHQVHVTTRIRLPTSAERRTMLCSPECRSEEHTSELQSRPHLVCRLLLEKKKKKYDNKRTYRIV